MCNLLHITNMSNNSKQFRWTVDEFKRRAIEIHGNKYDYTLIKKDDKIGNKIKVTIRCNTCNNIFMQSLDKHINRQRGCSNCNRTKKYTYESFIKRVTSLYNGSYDYSLIDPNSGIDHHTIINIKCLKCTSIFTQLVYNHINNKQGCNICDCIEINTHDLFIKKATSIYYDRYDYSLINFDDKITRDIKINIRCVKCNNIFTQTAYNHIYNKRGCTYCNNTKQYTYELFIKKANDMYHDRYDYSLVDPNSKIGNYSKIPIRCRRCGNIFMQNLDKHIARGQGCPICKASKGEIAVENYLKLCEFDFSREYSLPSLLKKTI